MTAADAAPGALEAAPEGPLRARALVLPGAQLEPEHYRGLLAALARGGVRATALGVPAFAGRGAPATWDGLTAAVGDALARFAPGGVLIGHSLGGLLALLAAARLEGAARPARLVLLEPAVAPGAGAARRAAAAYRRDVLLRDRERFVNRPGAFRRLHDPAALDADGLARYLAARREGDPEALGALLAATPALYPLPLAALDQPVLLARGAASGWRAALGAWLLARRLPRCRRAVVPRAGHWLPLERPDAVAALVLAWLDEDPPGRASARGAGAEPA